MTPEQMEMFRKKRDAADDIDVSNMSGKVVARHLYAAGLARKQGKEYDFPGYIKFPIKNSE